MVSRKIVGEALDCPDYDEFQRDVLDPLLKQYRPNDIYNADETSFFFRLLASRTYAFEEESVRGSKHITSKDRLSLLLCTNMTGTDKRRPLIIGKSQRPTALKRRSISIRQLGIEYYSNANGWMTAPIFQCWLKSWNEELIKQKREILLLIDNAPSHIIDDSGYSNIKVQFLPPNTTSQIQPLDQGIIRVTKCHYRKMICELYLDGIENKMQAKQIMRNIDFVVACQTLVKSWDLVTSELITKCFTRCYPCLKDGDTDAAEDDTTDDIVPAPRRNLWDNLQQVLQVHVPFEDYATADDAYDSCERVSEDEIADAVKRALNPPEQQDEQDPDDRDDDDDTEVVDVDGGPDIAARQEEIVKSSSEFVRYLDQQKAYLLKQNFPPSTLQALEQLESDFMANRAQLCRAQSNMFSFFKRA